MKNADLENMIIKLDKKAKRIGFLQLSSEERFLLIQGIRLLPEAFVDRLTFCENKTKESIIMLKKRGLNSYSKFFSIISEPFIHLHDFSKINRSPISDGPVVIFIANVGAQVPIANQTLGNISRGYVGVQPPLGQYYIASYLSLLGVETYVFNLALGNNEKKELEEKVITFKKRLWFVSFSSNFLSEEELDTVYYLANILETLKKEGLYPRLVGGGMGVYFSRDIYLYHTPIEIVVGRYGEPSFGDMIFSSDYYGPYDFRENILLFKDIPNLYIKIKSNDKVVIYQTEEIPLSLADRQVIANSLDISKVPLEKKYWLKNVIMSICVPDDLNISPEHLKLDDFNKEKNSFSVKTSNLHPSNYIFKPKAVKIMSTFGNCQRGCKFCQFTHYDESLYLIPAQEVVAQLNNIVKHYPSVQMFVFDDDDFMSRGKNIWELITILRENKPTQGRIFYIETIPVSLKYEVLSTLWEVGFRAILLGVESHSEKILYDIKKLKQGESFKQFIDAPKIVYDEGFFTRVTGIMFYPIMTIEDIIQNIIGFTDYIMYGIAVSIFPFVQVLPGSEFASEKNRFYKTYYQVRDNGKEHIIDLPKYVLPNDPFLNEIAFKSIKNTPAKLYELLRKHHITTDYPTSLGVLAFFKSIIQTLIEASNSLRIEYGLKEINELIEKAVEVLVKKHFIQLTLQKTFKSFTNRNNLTIYKIIEKCLEEKTISHLVSGLQMFLYFGDKEEIIFAAQMLPILKEFGIYDKYLTKSLEFCYKKEDLSQDQKKNIVEILGKLQ